ncbi:MAG: protein-disulfide reductase DsbD domain-containing protein [Pseudomonadota bacterium]
MRRILALILAVTLAGALPVAAQTIVSRGQSFVTAQVLPGEMKSDGTRLAGLALELTPGWKTYWRSPGPAGIPPRLDWSGSENLAAARLHWPTPAVFTSFGLTTIGYADRVLLPVELTPEDPEKPIAVDLALELGVCRDICVFEHVTLTATLPPDLARHGSAIEAALALRPSPGPEAGLVSATCRITGQGGKRGFTATLTFDREIAGAKVLLEGPKDVWLHGASTAPSGTQTLEVTAKLDLLSDTAWVSRKSIRMTVLGPDWAADIQGCNAPRG